MSDIKYQQLQDALKEELRSGRFKAGDRFYTNQEIMKKYNLSLITVARAMTEMTEQGYFERRRKLGTFVQASPEMPGKSGEVMVQPLYVNGWEPDEVRGYRGPSWFVVEEIRRGIINTYPGAVRIVPIDEISERLKSGEEVFSVLYHPSAEFVEAHEKFFQSSVVINTTRYFRMRYNSVTVEWMPGVYDAITYLIRELDHTRIAYIGRDERHFYERYGGYRIALESYELPPAPELVRRSPDYIAEESGEQAMNELLSLKEPPTAVFADSDWKALGAMNAIRKAGLRVPEDISVIGFDDMPAAKNFEPPLTTVSVPYFNLGKAAVDLLFEKLRQGNDVPTKVIKSELLIRKSTTRRNG